VTLAPGRFIASADCAALRLPKGLASWRIEGTNLLIESRDDGLVLGQVSDRRFDEIKGKWRLSRSS
jgi:hypothetical protein